MPTNPLRLFYALWADHDVCRQIAELTRPWQPQESCRWTATDKFHLTLAFLGVVVQERMGKLDEIGQSLQVPAFQIEFDRLEFWPRSEVLCLTASKIPEPLVTLVDQLGRALEAADFPTENRPYRPHLTLARRARRLPEGAENIGTFICHAKEWCLAESRPFEPDSPYRIVRKWSLRQGVGPHG